MSETASRESTPPVSTEARLLSPSAAHWADVLRRTDHDVYHLPEYAGLDAKVTGGTPAAFWYQEEEHAFLLPLILRGIPDSDLLDAVSPYGYTGPVSDASHEDTAFWRRACDQMVETLCANGVVTTFVRLHPLLPPPLDVLDGVGAVVQHGETVSVDLSLSREAMWRETRRDHRNQINRARRAGVEVVFDDWERLEEWVTIYHENMQRLGASQYYFYPCEHLTALHEAVGDRMHLAVALVDGEVVGGSTFFEYRGIVEGHVASTRHREGHHADKLLYDEIRLWAKDRGNAIMHVGGGVGGAEDLLFSYKAGFSSGRHSFHTWRVVTNGAAYANLLARRGIPPESVDISGYFPSYRKLG
ncbi:GNAT family N-acetyltransferase [Mycolicibacterium mengxianglii]|uniref:GNAT family N-acetyltransferase n=1 Tax=Mycolicibacterium mengxianglii TaxID=2736649 RepID=UPI0018D144D3|nr:GNAT family N-acetyltransferase [Mycolicibacterium mengxianglii]